MSEPISTIEDFIEWTKNLKSQKLLYRGLADVDHKAESSAYRRIKDSQKN